MKCVFCEIIRGNIPSHKIWENEKFLAVLDINPNVRGMALVLTKKHFSSYAVDMRDADYAAFFLAAKKVAKLLDRKLGTRRTALVMEGLGVDHAHIKLYPVHGLPKKFKEIWAKEKVFFRKYPGYITTQLGPRADEKELLKLSEMLSCTKKTNKKRNPPRQ
jgi:diadenosine tetraphosphate (Ap4A) HIT family hydrolase